MRISPYEHTVIEIAFRRMEHQFNILKHYALYALALELMVRPTVPDHVLYVRAADAWMGVVSTQSPSGVKRIGLS
jgi:hypothetical protein